MAVHTERLVLEAKTETAKSEADLAAYEAKVNATMQRLSSQGATIKVDVDPDFTGARTKLNAGIRALEASAPTIEIETKVDTDFLRRTFLNSIRGLQGAGGQLNMGNVFRDFAAGAQVAQSAVSGLASSLGGMGNAGAGAVSSLGGVGGSMSSIAVAAAVLIPLIAALIGVFGALVGAAGAVIGALSVIPAVIAGVIQAVLVLAAVLGPVFSAFQAFTSEQGKVSAGGGGGGGKAVQNAARQQELAARRVRDAQEALADARINAARGAEDAAERVSDAERRLADAQQEAARNQERLNEARKEAKERVDDLRISLRRLILDEERAVDNLESARQVYERTLINPFADAEDQADALLAVKEAEQDLTEVQEDRSDVTKELEKADKRGIDGLEEVQRALEENRQANRELRDSQEELSDAREAATDQQIESARAIRDAQENLNDALYESQRAAEGYGAALGGAGGAASAFQTQLAALSPAAQEFTKFLIDMWEAIQPLQLALQERFFAGLVDVLAPVAMTYLPIISQILLDTADVLNDWVEDFASLALNPRFVAAIESIGESNVRIIEDLGEAFLNLIDFFTTFMAVAAPFTEWLVTRFSDFTDRMNDAIQSTEGQDKLTEFFDSIRPTLDALGNFTWTFLEELLDLLIELQPSVAEFFEEFGDQLPGLFDAMEELLPPFIELGTTWLPIITDALRIAAIVLGGFATVMRFFTDVILRPLGLVLMTVGRAVIEWIVDKFRSAATTITNFRNTIATAIQGAKSIFQSGWNFIYNNFIKPFMDRIQGIRTRLSDFQATVKHVVGKVLEFFRGIIDWFNRNLGFILGPLREISGALGGISAAAGRAGGAGGGLGVLAGVFGLQTGGQLNTGGLVKVGERGEEIVALPRGAQVFNNDVFRGLAASVSQFTRSNNLAALSQINGSEEGSGAPLIGTLVMPPDSSVADAVAALDHYRRARMGIRR